MSGSRAAYLREYRKAHKEEEWESHLKRRYGLTKTQYDAMANTQGHKCALCPSTIPGTKRQKWMVDHSHKTGAVRGLLCHHCNLMLGHAKDNIETLARAIEYLKEDNCVSSGTPKAMALSPTPLNYTASSQ